MIQIDPEQWTHGASDALKLCGRNVEQRFRWSACVPGPAWQRGTPPPLFSFIWPFMLDLCGLRAILWSARLQLVHRWLRTPCSYLPGLPVQYKPSLHPWKGLWYCYERGPQNQEEQKAIWQPLATPGKSSSWRLRQAVWFLLEYWWWHHSRSPPVSSSSDLCSEHAGKG